MTITLNLTLPDGEHHVVEVRREMIGVTMGPGVLIRDEQWSFTDAAGHEHRYGGYGPLETLQARYGEPYWDECCGGEREDFLGYFCRQCGEKIEPGKLPLGMSRQVTARRTEYLIDGEYAVEQQVKELLARAAS